MNYSKSHLKIFLFWLILFLILLEASLRITGIFHTYSEKAEGDFFTYYGKVEQSHYLDWEPNQIVNRDYDEFSYTFTTNSIGLRDIEFHPHKSKNTFRLLTIGDSFTEGVGTTNDSILPIQLRKILKNNQGTQYEVWNAGVAGSDVIYCYKLFGDKLLDFNLDLVLLIINSSDITDIILRGGKERFLDDGRTVFKARPPLLTVYEYSHLCRAIFHTLGYNDLLISPRQKLIENKKSINIINQCISSFDSLSHDNGINFLTIFHAFPNEYKYGFKTEDDIRKVIPYLDSAGIPYISLHEPMAKYLNADNIDSYSWPIDGHYNGKGYEIMAKCIFEEIKSKYPELLQINEVQQTQVNTDSVINSLGLIGLN